LLLELLEYNNIYKPTLLKGGSPMKTFRRIGILTLTIILMTGVSGCMNLLQTSIEKAENERLLQIRAEEAQNELLTHLIEKYDGQEFVPIGLEYEFGVFTLHCYPAGGDPETDIVKVETRGNRIEGKAINAVTQDTYFGIIIREDVEAEVLAALSDLPLPMKVYFDRPSMYWDNFWDGSKTYADLKQYGIDRGDPYRFFVTIVVPMDGTDKTEKEEYANQVLDRLEKAGHRGLVSVCFFPNEAFEKVTRSLTAFNDLARQYRDEYALFSKSLNKNSSVQTNHEEEQY
jgi:hypothetical protein